ncbi:MAG: protein kinase, partial [Planctomycetes bacterium]|nr:protein kinase [Planctomycetota bacterium]
MPDPSSRRSADSQADPLLERCILAFEEAQMPGVEAILAEHPERADELRQMLQKLGDLGILVPSSAPVMPERLGDFRLLRPLGKGGMGIVYLAIQESLQREVALKLVRPEQLFFAGARERFRREVLAVARLDHPGIVPVHTFGEVDGLPFYAMARLHGVTLGEILQALDGQSIDDLDGRVLARGFATAMQRKGEGGGEPTAPLFDGAWVQACCQMVREMALALQHAHDNGVLHRDVKPSNAILTARGTVHLIDFGLASAHGEQRITRSGATLGSLPYMAPEQVRGAIEDIDARTDVYALGVTLYELLTLRLPHGDGSGTTRERILSGRVEPPTRCNARVHADAEAICLQAMELEPHRRYQSAGALADDLGRFLGFEPVLARRQTSVSRMGRWLRRHPAHATAIALAFTLLFVGPLVFAVQQSLAAARLREAFAEVKQQKSIADANLEEAKKQEARAIQNLDRALAAVDQMLSRTAEARLADIPRTAPLRRQLLEDALQFHEGLALAETGARTREERARSRRRVGQIRIDLGLVRPAIEVLEQAETDLRELLAEDPQSLRLQLESAETQGALSEAYYRVGERAKQYRATGQAIEHWAFAAAARPQSQPFRLSLSLARVDAVRQLADEHRFDEAHRLLDQLETDLRPDPEKGPKGEDLQRWLCVYSRVADARGLLWTDQGETQRAEEAFDLALERLQQAEAAAPEVHRARNDLVGLTERLALLAQQRREWLEATPRITQTIELLEKFAADEPEIPDWQARLATMIGARADNRSKLGDAAGAAADHDRAVLLLEPLAQRFPDEPQFRRRLAAVLGERGMSRAQARQFDEARADFERSIAAYEELVAAQPEDQQSKANLVASLANTSQLQAMTGDVATARRTIQRAIELNETREFGEVERSRIEVLMQAADLAMRDLDVD